MMKNCLQMRFASPTAGWPAALLESSLNVKPNSSIGNLANSWVTLKQWRIMFFQCRNSHTTKSKPCKYQAVWPPVWPDPTRLDWSARPTYISVCIMLMVCGWCQLMYSISGLSTWPQCSRCWRKLCAKRCERRERAEPKIYLSMCCRRSKNGSARKSGSTHVQILCNFSCFEAHTFGSVRDYL